MLIAIRDISSSRSIELPVRRFAKGRRKLERHNGDRRWSRRRLFAWIQLDGTIRKGLIYLGNQNPLSC